MTEPTASAPPARRIDISQLAVTKTLRIHQREWFARLREEVAAGAPFAIGSASTPHEIFEALDIRFVTDVWYSAVVAAKRMSAHYSDVLTAHGFHPGLSRYAALALATELDARDVEKPWGGLPAANLVVGTSGDRSGQALAAHWGVPYVAIAVPAVRALYPNWWEMSAHAWEALDEPWRIDLMVAQFEELIALCEKIAGKRLDRDRLREIVERVNRQEEHFEEVRQIIRTAPKLPVRLDEVMGQVMGIQWHRGTEWAEAQARAFRDEVRARADAGQWVCDNEQVRLMYVGAGLWQKLEFFAAFERSHGATFVRSNYLSLAVEGYVRYGTRDPVRALASRYVTFNRQMHLPPMAGAWAVWEAQTHRVDGAIQIRSGSGLKFNTNALEAAGIPVLDFPVDPVDAKTWDEDRLRTMMTDFLERRVGARKIG